MAKNKSISDYIFVFSFYLCSFLLFAVAIGIYFFTQFDGF